jgi:hypothetical protein
MGITHSLQFYFLRLQYSSLPEIISRVKEFFFLSRMRTRLKKNKVSIDDSLSQSADIDLLQLPTFQYRRDDSLLQSLCAGEIFTLNGDKEEIREFENITRGRFSCDIPVSQGTRDIRMVWEPARLQHLTILLISVQKDSTQPYAKNIKEFVKNSLLTWLDRNPFLSGPHYQSAMECGLRIPVFFYALKILDNLDQWERQRILTAIYQHAWWISWRLSLYSSLGNHTVCESVGLVFAGGIFSSAPESRAWLNRGIELLKQELFHQILEDGGPAEQSLNYHRFVLDLYWLTIDFMEKNRLHDCTSWKPRLKLGETFIRALADDQGNHPAIGDSDDGQAIAPGIQPLRGSLIFNELHKLLPTAQGNWPMQDQACGYQNEYYLGKNQIIWKTYPEAGYTIIRSNNDLIFTFDHGPLGMPPLYGHGHADALSITLAIKGRAILVDPGTYRYNGAPELRRYFKGTRGHNTVTVDGRDQAEQKTGFLWGRPFKARLFRTCQVDDGLILEGSHDGYERLKKPVEHLRSVFFFGGCNFLVRDTFAGTGIHDFELNYHLHPKAVIDSVYRSWWIIKYEDAKVYIRLFSEGNFKLIIGQETPPFGWFSPAYGVKLKSGVLNKIQRGDVREVSFLTAICTGHPEEDNFFLEKGNLL